MIKTGIIFNKHEKMWFISQPFYRSDAKYASILRFNSDRLSSWTNEVGERTSLVTIDSKDVVGFNFELS